MSKPRYDWWPYVKGMIRRYPRLREEHRDLQSQSIVPGYTSATNPSGTISRPVEQCITRGLTGVALREYEAVAKAVEQTRRLCNGEARVQIIRSVYWQGYTLESAAVHTPCSIATAKRWHGDFIRLVAKTLVCLKVDTPEPKNCDILVA